MFVITNVVCRALGIKQRYPLFFTYKELQKGKIFLLFEVLQKL